MGGQGAGFGQGFGFGDIMDAFFGTQSRGPRPRMGRGKDALIRLQVTLADATFGATRDRQQRIGRNLNLFGLRNLLQLANDFA